jgi:hypothetical protein
MKKHGDAAGRKTPEYIAWVHMVQRCEYAHHEFFQNYGGRGIRVCERWRQSYPAFLADMGRRPSPEHSLDRIDYDGHYEPGNCRWATDLEQNRNRRSSRFFTLNGKTACLSEWAKQAGMGKQVLTYRLRAGISLEEALTTKVRPWKRRAR